MNTLLSVIQQVSSMKVAKKEAVFAIASLIDDNDIAQSAIIQDGVAPIVAKAVSEAAISAGVRKKTKVIENNQSKGLS